MQLNYSNHKAFQRLRSEVIEFLPCRSRFEPCKAVLSSRQCAMHTSVYCMPRYSDTFKRNYTELLTEMFDSYSVLVPLFWVREEWLQLKICLSHCFNYFTLTVLS